MKYSLCLVADAFIGILLLFTSCRTSPDIPETWLKDWSVPPVELRPLQIVHGADIRKKGLYFRDTCGLGGVVCNVNFGDNYLKSEEDWRIFTEGVKEMQALGLRVWIYDEDGYPSLGAGGLVLASDSSLEAQELVFDSKSPKPLSIRRCYEFTHACNNYYEARRYPNPLNPKSTETFIRLTHQSYLEHLGQELFGNVEAFFTDEPSMMAVNIGQLREDVRKNVKVTDTPDLKKRNFPMVSWTDDLPDKFKTHYGKELLSSAGSLFSGSQEDDKIMRQQFWSLLAQMDRNYYYDAIRDWCKTEREKNGGKGPVSSGHCLREEEPAAHVPLDGNKLLVTSGFDIPGLDQLNSDPNIWGGNSWMAVFFPNSAARLNGQRRVMCEMSDFDQTLSGKDPVSLKNMEAATAWQMAFGVTDFNLYYSITYGEKYPDRTETEYKKYCTFVGRINAILKQASPVRNVLLYYPIYDLQREYIPTAEPLSIVTQSELLKTVETSFIDLGSSLLKQQTQFVLVDYLTLGDAKVTDQGTIQIGEDQYGSLLFPRGIGLPSSLTQLIKNARTSGVNIVFADDFNETSAVEKLLQLSGNENKLNPASTDIAFGKFIRDGKQIFILVNTGKDAYNGTMMVENGKRYIELNPQTGIISKSLITKGKTIDIHIDPCETRIITRL